jgi:hypothetical protein
VLAFRSRRECIAQIRIDANLKTVAKMKGFLARDHHKTIVERTRLLVDTTHYDTATRFSSCRCLLGFPSFDAIDSG